MNFLAKLILHSLPLLAKAFAHSWVEQLEVVNHDGVTVGSSGYARGNGNRLGENVKGACC